MGNPECLSNTPKYYDNVNLKIGLISPPSKCNFLESPLAKGQPKTVVMSELIEEGSSLPRGRPKTAVINELIEEGATSTSPIKCHICCRVFPREKSLQAHLRIHTGERPYMCGFTGCKKSFRQSGQLKTHIRLHTGEKPFECTFPGCCNRFTHSNRHCSIHPKCGLKRIDSLRDVSYPISPLLKVSPQNRSQTEQNAEPASHAFKKKCTNRSLTADIENQHKIIGEKKDVSVGVLTQRDLNCLDTLSDQGANKSGLAKEYKTPESYQSVTGYEDMGCHIMSQEPTHLPESIEKQKRFTTALALLELSGCTSGDIPL